MWVSQLLFGLRSEMLTKFTLNIFSKGTISATEKNVFKNVWQLKIITFEGTEMLILM